MVAEAVCVLYARQNQEQSECKKKGKINQKHFFSFNVKKMYCLSNGRKKDV